MPDEAHPNCRQTSQKTVAVRGLKLLITPVDTADTGIVQGDKSVVNIGDKN